MSKEAVVSIITPMYNCSEFIKGTIETVQKQTFTNWEMLIIDDCSTDNSVSIAKEIEDNDQRIKIISLRENSGAAIARNAGIKHATGKYIAFLDSDDLWFPNKLETQVEFMEKNNIAFSYTEYVKITENGEERGIVEVPGKVTYGELLKTNVIGCLTAIYDVKKIGKIYMPNIRKRQDYALWLEILKNHTDAYGINECLAKYRVRQNSVSSNKFKAAMYQWKVYRDVEKLSLVRSIYYFINYACYGFKKYRT